jgi:hypothetical protein
MSLKNIIPTASILRKNNNHNKCCLVGEVSCFIKKLNATKSGYKS